MADLGNLFFSLGLNTESIDKAWDAALKKYGKLAKIDLKVDTKELSAAKEKTGLINEAAKQTVITKKAQGQVERDNLKTLQQQAMVEAKINTESARAQSIHDKTTSSISRTNNALTTQNRLMQNLRTMAASYISIFAAGRLLKELVQIGGEFEMQKTSLRAILGDLEGANAIFAQIQKLAVKSPFQFKDLISYTKQLSAFSVPMNELYDTTKMLADLSAGLGVGMDRLVLAYGQIRAASFLRGQEVRQLTEAGVPILEILRKEFELMGQAGLTAGDVFDKISSRQVPFDMVKKAFIEMTSEGGKFYNMQEIQSETLKGKVSNLIDAYQIMFGNIAKEGSATNETLKWGVDAVRLLMTNYEAIGKIIVTLAATYGVYQTALLITAIANGTLMTSNSLLITSFFAVRNAMTALTAAMAANPYMAIALGVTTVIGTMWALRDSSTAAEKAQARLDATMKSLEETKGKMAKDVSGLINTITSETSSVYDQVKAWDELIKRYAFFSQYSIDDLRKMTAEQRAVLVSSFTQKEGKAQIESLYKDKLKQIEDLKGRVAGLTSGAMDFVKKTIGVDLVFGAGDKMALKYAKELSLAKEEANGLAGSLREIERIEKEAQKRKATSTTQWSKNVENYIKSNKIEKFGFGRKEDEDPEEYIDRIRKEFETLTELIANRSKLAGEDVSGLKGQLKSLSGVFGIIGISPLSDKANAKANAKAEKEANKDALDILQQKIDYIDKVKKAYADLISAAGEQNSGAVGDFINNLFGTSYTTEDFGTGFKSSIEPIIAQMSLLGDKGKEAADKLRISLKDAFQGDAIKQYSETLKSQNKIREDANKLLTEQKAKEGDLQRLLDERDLKMSEIADNEENAAELRDAIFNDYKDQILTIGKEWLKTLGLEGDAAEFIKGKIKEIIPLFKSIDKLNLSELTKLSSMLDTLEIDPKVLEFLKIFGIDVEKLNEAIKTAAKTTKEEQVDPKQWEKITKYVNMYANSLSQIGAALEDMGGMWGEIGSVIVGVTANAENLVIALGDAKPEEKIGAGLSAISSLAVMIINQAKANKQAQEDWNLSIIDGAHQMALLKIEAESYQDANIFGIENPYAKAIAGVREYAKAMASLNKDWSGAQVQIGTKKVADAGNIATGMGTGAVIGALVSGPFALIGAAIGAVIGGAIALFAAPKTVAVWEDLAKKYGQIFDENLDLNPQLLADYKKLNEQGKMLVDNWEAIKAKAKEALTSMRDTLKELAGEMGTQLSDALVNAFRNGDLYSAIDTFKDYVVDAIESIISQMVFAMVFQKYLDELQTRMERSIGIGPNDTVLPAGAEGYDNSIVDDIQWFADVYKKGLEDYNKYMKDWQNTMAGQGYSVFAPTTNGTTSNLGTAIKEAPVTENTANLLGSYINAIRADSSKQTMSLEKITPLISNINDTMGNGLAHLAAISSNTFRSAVGIEHLVDKVDALTSSGGATKLNVSVKV